MKTYSHVRNQVLAQTGGWCMVDFFALHDNTTMGITDEGIGLSHQGMDDEYDQDQVIGHIDICHHVDDTTIKYPEPTAYHRTIDESTPNLTGWYVEKHEVCTEDDIVYFDRITMRNGIVVTIDDAQIVVMEDETENFVIGYIQRP